MTPCETNHLPVRAHQAVFKTLRGKGGGPGDDQRLQVTRSNERNQGDGEVEELLLPAEDHFLLFFSFFSFQTVRAAGGKKTDVSQTFDGVTHVNPVSHLKNAGGKKQTRKKKERKKKREKGSWLVAGSSFASLRPDSPSVGGCCVQAALRKTSLARGARRPPFLNAFPSIYCMKRWRTCGCPPRPPAILPS